MERGDISGFAADRRDRARGSVTTRALSVAKRVTSPLTSVAARRVTLSPPALQPERGAGARPINGPRRVDVQKLMDLPKPTDRSRPTAGPTSTDEQWPAVGPPMGWPGSEVWGRWAHTSRVANNGLIKRLLYSPRVARFLKYAVGSATASLVSFIVLAVVSWDRSVPDAVASVIAFIAGALVNFCVYRFWAWRHTVTRKAKALGRDFGRYAVIAVSTALIATGTTTLAGRYADHAGLGSAARTLLLEGSYFSAFALMFVVKFLLLDRFVFAARHRADVSRDQVENTTPA